MFDDSIRIFDDSIRILCVLKNFTYNMNITMKYKEYHL